jgi:hypothetical protein
MAEARPGSTGSVTVEVVPDARNWTARLSAQVIPDAAKIGAEWGKVFAESAAKAVGNPLEDAIKKAGEAAQRAAVGQGAQAGGKFAASLRATLQAALKDLPEIKLDADSSDVEREIAAIRAELKSLGDKKIGIDIDAAAALAKVAALRERLQTLSKTGETVDLRVDTAGAMANLEAFERKIKQIDSETAKVKVRAEADEGQFVREFRSALASAQAALPDLKLDADSTAVDREIAAIQMHLRALGDKTIGVDLNSASALAAIARLRERLADLDRNDVDVSARFDAAAATAAMAAFEAKVRELDGKEVDVEVDADTANAERKIAGIGDAGSIASGRILSLVGAIALVGPAVGPLAGIAAGAFGAIAVGAVAAAGAVGVLVLALTPVIAAATAYSQQQNRANTAASQGASRALALAGAQDAVKSALRGLSNAQENAAVAAERANRRVEDASRALAKATADATRDRIAQDRRVADARRDLGDVVDRVNERQVQAATRVRSAERSLADAQRGVLTAQQRLNDARREAVRDMEDLNAQLRRGSLDERQAVLDLADAQRELALQKAAGTATDNEVFQRAQLAYDEAVQRLEDIRRGNTRLAEEKAAADQAGVEGDRQVVDARQGVVDAERSVADAREQLLETQRQRDKERLQGERDVADAMRAVQDAIEESDRRRAESAERIADAQRALADSERDRTDQIRRNAEAVLSAQEAVENAHRGVERAAISAGNAGGVAMEAFQKKMAALAPEGRAFVKFGVDEFMPWLQELSRAGQAAFLPGLTAGMRAVMAVGPSFRGVVSSIGGTLGDMAERAGRALAGPFWQDFLRYIRDTAPGHLIRFGSFIGNIAEAAVGLLRAFEPVAVSIEGWLISWSARFADLANNTDPDSPIQQFMRWLKAEGPGVAQSVLEIVRAFGELIIKLTPMGVKVLEVAGAVATFIADAPAPVLMGIAVAIGALATGLGALNFALSVARSWRVAVAEIQNLGLAAGITSTKISAVKLATVELSTIGVAAAIVAGNKIGGMLSDLIYDAEGAKAGVDEVRVALERLSTSGSTDALDAIFAKSKILSANDINTFADAIDRLANPGLVQRLNDFGDKLTFGLFAGSNSSRKQVIDDLKAIDTGLATMAQSGNVKAAQDAFALLASKASASGLSVDDLKRLMPQYAQVLGNSTPKVQAAADAQKALTEAQERSREVFLAGRAAEREYYDALDAARQAIKDNGATLDTHTAAGRANQAALDRLAQAANGYTDSLVANGASQKELDAKNKEVRGSLISVQTQMGTNKKAAQEYTGEVLKTPKEAKTEYKTPGGAEAAETAREDQRALRNLAGQTEVTAKAHESMWQKIKNAAKEPVRWMIDVVINKGILAAWNWIASKLGLPDGMRNVQVPIPAGLTSSPGSSGGVGSWGDGEGVPRSKVGTGEGIGSTLSNLKDFGADLVKVFTDPTGWLKDRMSSSLGQFSSRFGGSDFAKLVGAVPSRLIDLLGDRIKALLPGGGDLSGLGGASVPGGIGWQRQWAIVKGQFPNAVLTSSYRPGAITSSGNPSYHSMGRAIDITPDMAIFNWLRENFGATSKELIYTPAGARQIKDGRPYTYSGQVAQDHFNHIHWAYDQGGYLPPGYSTVFNGTGKPEPVLTSPQWEKLFNFFDSGWVTRLAVEVVGVKLAIGTLQAELGVQITAAAGSVTSAVSTGLATISGSITGAQQLLVTAITSLGDRIASIGDRIASLQIGGYSGGGVSIPSGPIAAPPTTSSPKPTSEQERLKQAINRSIDNAVSAINMFRPGGGPLGRRTIGATFDSGGYLPPGVSTVFNGTGRPEPVLTGSQWDDLRTVAAGRSIHAEVTVNNPVPETASESTTRTMRRLAYLGPNA